MRVDSRVRRRGGRAEGGAVRFACEGDEPAESDIDLAVSGGERFDAFYRRVQDDLWSLLKVDVVNLDVVNLDEPISEDLKHEIAIYGMVLYEKV